ncbi:PilZ domain-containing protein [Permianibacter sp. IMCC34836]|uniref:PilZ domain-containing protein n=1 Tax=Permianibacter fluminis TaxID=2738515 RepID=UPI001551ACCD|nr:PilZ domain-containing protein [Permianibacter fluminis]NQD35565.1 PilZ domain-containing protein [Permianibacter fluminis]
MSNKPEQEQRQENRLASAEPVHIQILRQVPTSVATTAVLHANTHDISSSGFNALSNVELTPGLLLDVLIELRDGSQPYLLTAEVRWCQAREGGNYSVGFVVMAAQGSDFQAWQTRFR